MKITDAEVFGLDKALVRSGYPARIMPEMRKAEKKDLERAVNLSNNPSNSGHNSFLKQITVHADFRMPQYWWLQSERYHFFEISGSESKMYTLLKSNLDDLINRCNGLVKEENLNILKTLIEEYKNSDSNETERNRKLQEIISNTPMGLELTAAINTNYLQLKNIYHQRKDHRLPEWGYTCKWIADLPLADKLIIGTK
jgi:hypothetical protein